MRTKVQDWDQIQVSKIDIVCQIFKNFLFILTSKLHDFESVILIQLEILILQNWWELKL